MRRRSVRQAQASWLLRTGTPGQNVTQLATRLLHAYNGLPGLAVTPISVLTECHGVSTVKAIEPRHKP